MATNKKKKATRKTKVNSKKKTNIKKKSVKKNSGISKTVKKTNKLEENPISKIPEETKKNTVIEGKRVHNANLLSKIKQYFKNRQKSNAKIIEKNKKNNFKKMLAKKIRKMKMYGVTSVIPKKVIITSITTLATIIILIFVMVFAFKSSSKLDLKVIPEKIDQLTTVSFNIDDSSEIISSSKAYTGLKDYYEYDFDNVFGLNKDYVEEYVIKYNKTNNELFVVIKASSGNQENIKQTFDTFISKNKITDYLYEEYEGYQIYIKTNSKDNNAIVISKIKQSQIRVFSILQELKKDDIDETLGIKESYYDEALVKTAMLRSDTCEYVIIKPKNINCREKIKAAMAEHYDGLEAKWQGKNQVNYNLVNNHYEGEYNGYLIYIVSNNNDLVLQLIKGLEKK